MNLAPEIQHLVNLVQTVFHRAERDLFRAVSAHDRRATDKGRTLIQSALGGAANLQATQTELRVTLAPLNSPRRT